jgi:hypothetical protein
MALADQLTIGSRLILVNPGIDLAKHGYEFRHHQESNDGLCPIGINTWRKLCHTYINSLFTALNCTILYLSLTHPLASQRSYHGG